MRLAALALAGGTAVVTAVAGWELRAHWLVETLQIVTPLDNDVALGELPDRLRLPANCAGYRRVRSSEGGRQQVYVKSKDAISLFLPASTAAEIAAAPGWSVQNGNDGSAYYTLIGQNEHCAVSFIYGDQPVVLASKIKTGRLIEFAEKLRQALDQHR